MRLLIGILLLFITVQITTPTDSIAGTRLPSVPDSKYLEYGKKHQCVLPIQGIMSNDLNSTFRGSCILISPKYIITAAHVVAGSLSQNVIFNNKVVPVSIIAIHSDWKYDKTGIADIAVGKLSKPINLDFYPELYTESDEMSKVCSMAGYGHHGTFKTGWKPFDNKRRAGSNLVAEMYKDCLLVKSDDAHTSLEFLIAPGDSGGGMFIDQKLAGINSFIMATDGKGDSDYGDDACFTRISKFIPWIKAVKEQIEIIDKLTPEQIATIQKIQKERVKSEKKK
jgi:V8-like Glu-specific endopeptidase